MLYSPDFKMVYSYCMRSLLQFFIELSLGLMIGHLFLYFNATCLTQLTKNTSESILYLFRDNPIDFRYEDDIDSNDEDNEANEYPDEEAGLQTIRFMCIVVFDNS